MVKIFLLFFSRYPIQTTYIGILFLLENLMEGIGLSMVVPVFEKMFRGEESSIISSYLTDFFNFLGLKETLESTLILVIAVFILKSLIMVLSKYLVSNFASKFLNDLQIDTFKKILHGQLSYFQNQKTAIFVNTLTTESQRAAVTFIFSAQWLSFAMSLILYMVLSFWVAGGIAIVSIFAGIILISPLKLISLRNEKYGKKLTEFSEMITVELFEMLDGFKIIKAYAKEKMIERKFSNTLEEFRRNWQKVYFHSNSLHIYSQPLVIILLCLILFFAKEQGLSFGQMILFLVSFQRMLPAFTQMISVHNNILMTIPGYHVVQSTAKEANAQREQTGNVEDFNIGNIIRFKDVEFSYGTNPQKVLNKVNFEIPPSQTTAIVGPSGSGKTTIVDLLLSFYHPQKGNIYIGNHPLGDINIAIYRSQIAYVSQSPVLFNGTIKDNILWSNPDASDLQLYQVLEQSAAMEFVKLLEHDIHTMIGDKGVKLSGGQRQRIALARALIGKPRLLILDEATSALDYESENLISESIKRLRKNSNITIVVIAHRFETIKDADNIIVIRNGHIEIQGNWQELVSIEGSYIHQAFLHNGSNKNH